MLLHKKNLKNQGLECSEEWLVNTDPDDTEIRLPNNKILNWSKLKGFEDDNSNVSTIIGSASAIVK